MNIRPLRLLAAAALGACLLALVAAPFAGAATTKPPTTYFFGGTASVLFDPAVLTPLAIQVVPGAGAVPTAQGVRVKVTEGSGSTRYPLKGQIRSVKGLTLAQGTARITLNWFNIGLGKGRPMSALVGVNTNWGPRMTLFTTQVSKSSVVALPGRFQLNAVPVLLTATGATLFNQVFGAGAAPFAPGQRVGTLQVRTRTFVA